MSYQHLNMAERNVIYRMRYLGKSLPAIAEALGRNKGSISRELRRNVNRAGRWLPDQAHMYATGRKRQRIRRPKTGNAELMTRVAKLLEEKWSPEQIAEHLRLHAFPDDPAMWISHERIYQYIWADKARGGTLYKHLRRGVKRYHKRGNAKGSRGQIKDRVFIDDRPGIVDTRSRVGDWEGDTMVGKGRRGYLATFVERNTRRTIIRKMDNKRAETLNQAAAAGFKGIPADLIHTLTFDNGKEFARFKELEKAFDADVYFCHPYSSWEKGAIENINGLIRQFVPKETNILELTQKELNRIAEKLNNRPRKVLGYRTPNSVFQDALVALRC